MKSMYDNHIIHNLLYNGASAIPMYKGHIGMFNHNIPYAEEYNEQFLNGYLNVS